MKLNPVAAAVKSAVSNITPSEPTNTQVVLASQQEPQKKDDIGGPMPEPNALVSDRAKVLREIAERRNAQAVAESAETMPVTDEDGKEVESNPTPEPEDKPDIESQESQQTPDASQETVAAQPAATPAAPEEVRTLIVDGKPIQVPVSKIIERGAAAIQKEVAADERLRQANEILAQAKKFAEQSQPPKGVGEPAYQDLSDDQLAELIQFGTKEQAALAVKALRAPRVNPEEIIKAARDAVGPQVSFEAGKSFAVQEYGDLLSDPDLGAIFLTRENAARAAGDTRSHIELYKAIGEEIRTKFNRPKQGAAQPTPTKASTPDRTMEEKLAAKAAAPAAPRLASARLDGDATTPRPPTRLEIIEQQRRARGFDRLNHIR